VGHAAHGTFKKKHIKCKKENLKETDNLKRQGVEKWIILKWILKK
jgi:hypothetical protein